MAAPAGLRSNYGDLFGAEMLPVLEELFTNELEQYSGVREQVFKVVPHDREIWQSSEILDMPLFSTVAEGADYTFSAPAQGSDKTLTVSKYGRGFSVSEEMVDDGKFDMVGIMTRKLARSGRESQEIAAMNVFNNGFTTETAHDGLSVFNAAHTVGAGTYRNTLSVASDLSETSLQTALADFETVFVGSSGIIERIRPRIILVHPSNKRLAIELIGSDLKPGTANNNLNSIKGDGLIVVSSPHLTDPDAWFLCASPEETGLRIIERKPLETVAAGMDAGYVNDSILYKARYREAIGVTHAKGILGTPGAA